VVFYVDYVNNLNNYRFNNLF